MLKAIIFDFDGVLGDTWAMNMEVTKLIHPDIKEQDLKDFHNGNVHAGGFKLSFSKEQADFFFQEMHRRFEKKHLFPLKDEIKLLAKKYNLFIVSSSSEVNLQKYLECGDLLQDFVGFFGPETDRSKVAKFNMIFEKNNLLPEECLFFTDTLGDLKEANEVNLSSVAVTWGYQDYDNLQKGNPYKIISKFEEFLPVIEEFKDKKVE